ncbi:hypothetical protein CHS0354_009038, partial [Potamilus streckersoni]
SRPPTPNDRAKSKKISFWDRKNASLSSLELDSQNEITYEKQADERGTPHRKPLRKKSQTPAIMARKEFDR